MKATEVRKPEEVLDVVFPPDDKTAELVPAVAGGDVASTASWTTSYR